MIWIIKFFNALPKVDSEIVIQESEKIGAIEDLGPLLEPDPIGYSFNTPGWYLIGSLLLMGILYASYRKPIGRMLRSQANSIQSSFYYISIKLKKC